MIKNIIDWFRFALKHPLDRGSFNEVLQKVFGSKEVSICTVSDGDGSDVHVD